MSGRCLADPTAFGEVAGPLEVLVRLVDLAERASASARSLCSSAPARVKLGSTSEPGFYRCRTPVAPVERKLERVGVCGKSRDNENNYPQRRGAGPSLASPP